MSCPPALVATHTYANPVVAVFLGWLLASEPLTRRVLLATAVILGAIVLIRRGERTTVSPVAAKSSAGSSSATPSSEKVKSFEQCA